MTEMKPMGRWRGLVAGLGVLGCLLAYLGSAPFLSAPGWGLGALLAAAGCWLWGLPAWWRGDPLPGGWASGLMLVVALRVVAGLAGPQLSDDIYRYVWEGDLMAQGKSPYAYPPEAPEREEQRLRMPAVYGLMNHTDVSAAYPIVTQSVTALTMATLHGGEAGIERDGPLRLRWVFGLCDVLVLLPLLAILRRRRLPQTRVLVWGAAPLAAVEFAGSGHFDSFGIACLVGALACLPERGEARASAAELLGIVLFMAAVWTKLLPVMLVPFVLRGAGWLRRLLTMALVSAAFHLPILFFEEGSQSLLRGLRDYGNRWEGGSLVYRWILAGSQEFGASFHEGADLGRYVAVGVLLLALGLLWRKRATALDAAPVLLGVFAAMTPMLHPWYVAWLVPCLAWRARWSWAWLAAAAPLLYAPLAAYRESGVWEEPPWVWPLLALPAAGLGVWEWLRRCA